MINGVGRERWEGGYSIDSLCDQGSGEGRGGYSIDSLCDQGSREGRVGVRVQHKEYGI